MIRNIIEGLQLLSKYDEKAEVCAIHDAILVNIAKETVSEDDADTLYGMGWYWSDEHEGWRKFT